MGFYFLIVKECLVLEGGFCLREGRVVNLIFLHVRDDCFGFLRGVSCSSDVYVGYLIRGICGVLFLSLVFGVGIFVEGGRGLASYFTHIHKFTRYSIKCTLFWIGGTILLAGSEQVHGHES